jgi:polyhydroxybutyrate depolymerase
MTPEMCATAFGFAALGLGFGRRSVIAALLHRTLARPHAVSIGGITRKYLLYAPESLPQGQRVPLVLMFHGSGNLAAYMPALTGFDQYAETEHFIVAYPQGLNRQWNDGRGQCTSDDVAFVRALLDEIERTYPVDPRRIYAAGLSNGGFFVNRLACELSDRIAAIASVGATIAAPLAASAVPPRPVSVLYVHGDEDPLVPIQGGKVGLRNGSDHGRCVSLAEAVEFWRRANGIAPPPAIEDIPDRVRDGTHVRRESWSGGNNHAQVVAYIVRGGGHAWPGGPQYLPKFVIGRASQNLDATREICGFFDQHSLQ